MRPSKGRSGGADDLLRSRLDQIINMRHGLVRLAGEITRQLRRRSAGETAIRALWLMPSLKSVS